MSEYGYYNNKFWSSVEDHKSGECQRKLCLYCAGFGISLTQQKRERDLSPEHREAIRLHREPSQ